MPDDLDIDGDCEDVEATILEGLLTNEYDCAYDWRRDGYVSINCGERKYRMHGDHTGFIPGEAVKGVCRQLDLPYVDLINDVRAKRQELGIGVPLPEPRSLDE